MDTTIRTAQMLGLTSSLLLAGANIGSSYLALPILWTMPPATSTPFFHQFYLRGAASLVPLGIFSASCSALVAYLTPAQRSTWVLAAVATASQTPWTVLVMMATNQRLIAIAVAIAAGGLEGEKASVSTGEEVGGLLRKWAWMNVVRGCLALVGGLAGVYGMMES